MSHHNGLSAGLSEALGLRVRATGSPLSKEFTDYKGRIQESESLVRLKSP